MMKMFRYRFRFEGDEIVYIDAHDPSEAIKFAALHLDPVNPDEALARAWCSILVDDNGLFVCTPLEVVNEGSKV